MLKNSLFLIIVLLTSMLAQAQSGDGDKPKSGKKDNKGELQNQKNFLKYDEAHTPYNYDIRKEVDPLMQPRVALPKDSSIPAYQSGGAKGKRQAAFLNRETYYPAKPRNQWELGLNGGVSAVSGDVTPILNPLKNWGAGLYIRKSLGYIMSMRVRYLYGQSQGMDWKPKSNGYGDKGYNGYNPGSPDYVGNSALEPHAGVPINMNDIFFRNYKCWHHEAALEGVVTLGNVRFHRERSRFNSYISFGVGALAYKTMLDIGDNTNKNKEYNYYPMFDRYYQDNPSETSDPNFYLSRKKDVLDMLKDMQDGEYETPADSRFTQNSIFKDYTLQPSANVGFAIGYHVAKWMSLNLETRVTFTGDDLLDGQRFLEDIPLSKGQFWGAQTPSNDNMLFTGIDVNFHLFKKATEPLWWLNPLDYTYKKVADMDPEAFMQDYIADNDSDGVVNKFDMEPLTPKGYPVNTHGVSLDSDKDGCPDGTDTEPFSPPGYPIVNCVAQIPKTNCCDSMNKGDGLSTGRGYDCSKISLPDVVFDSDKYGIKPENLAILHLIAEKMQMCPDFNIVITSHADYNTNMKYNEQLSWNRQNRVVQYMVEKYGISRDRFIINYKADKKASEGQDMNSRKVDFRFANDGEKGNSNPPAPHPGLKAGREF